MPDAYTVASKGISRKELLASGCEEEKADDIFKVVPYVSRYFGFVAMVKLGVTVSPRDLDYDKGLFFAWIAEGAGSGRGN